MPQTVIVLFMLFYGSRASGGVGGITYPSVVLGLNVTLEAPDGQTCADARWVRSDGSTVARFDRGGFQPGAEYENRVTPVNDGSFSVVISGTTFNDQGAFEFTCNSTHVATRVLSVLVPSEQSVLEGGDTVLKCHSKTETAASEPVRWEKDGRLVHQEDFASRKASSSADFQGRVSVSAGGYRDGDLSLVLREARKTDQGVYRCFHGGKKGNPAAVNLTVHPGGTWTVPGYSIIIAALLCVISVPLGALAGWFLKSRRNARRNAGEGNDREMQLLASQTNGHCSNGAPAGGQPC